MKHLATEISGNLSVKKQNEFKMYILEKKSKTEILTHIFNKIHAHFNIQLRNTTYSQSLTIVTGT